MEMPVAMDADWSATHVADRSAPRDRPGTRTSGGGTEVGWHGRSGRGRLGRAGFGRSDGWREARARTYDGPRHTTTVDQTVEHYGTARSTVVIPRCPRITKLEPEKETALGGRSPRKAVSLISWLRRAATTRTAIESGAIRWFRLIGISSCLMPACQGNRIRTFASGTSPLRATGADRSQPM